MWLKKDASCSIEEVIERNTQMNINDFLNPSTDYKIVNLEKFAEVVKKSIANKTKITIYGDYDCDGITSSAILYLLLTYLGAKDIDVILPKRFSEGYGLSMASINRINEGLLITVDNGIAAIDEIKAAKDKGLTVLVLDHHLIREDGLIPEAEVSVNPNALLGGDFSKYCGAGLAFKLAQLLTDNSNVLDRLETLAAIGTVADVMELVSDNRNIVKKGLELLNSGKTVVGLKALIEELGLYYITETDFGFKFGPIINAAGRIYDDGAMMAFELLISNDFAEAKEKARKLIDINEERKRVVEAGMETCRKLIADRCLYGESPLVIYTTKEDERQGLDVLHEGVVGVLAGRLVEENKCPVVVLTETSEGILKGSGRSYGDVHLKDLLDKTSEHILKYGGHAGAAGLSVSCDKIEDFIYALQNAMTNVKVAEQCDDRYYDLEITSGEVRDVAEKLRQYAPFGNGNPPITFLVKNTILTPKNGKTCNLMGAKCEHIKLFCNGFDVVAFGMAEAYRDLDEPVVIDVLGNVSENHFNEKVSIQVEASNIRPGEAKPKTGLAASLAELMSKNGL